MKKVSLIFLTAGLLIMVAPVLSGQESSKLVSKKSHVSFFSHTPVEDIEANNFGTVGTINPATGDVVFSVPMQGFEFEKALMQKHFNSDNFLDTKAFPKGKLVGKITNLEKIDFMADGEYEAMVEGDLTIKGKTNRISEKGMVKVSGGMVEVNSKFKVTLADYGITFAKGKPSTNIAKEVEVTVIAEFGN